MHQVRAGSIAGALALAAAAHAASVDLSFTRITSNAGQNVESQFLTTVATVTGDTTVVDFIFRNNVGVASSISEIFFDNGAASALFSGGGIVQQVGTSFVFGSASPPDLPGGDTLADPFVTTLGFLADAQGNPSLGIDTAADLLNIRLNLRSGITFGDVTDALTSGDLRLGLHVRSIGADGDSDGFVNTPPPVSVVPLPSGGALAAAGLLTLTARRRRRR